MSMDYGGVFECTCNTQNPLLLNQHNGDDAPQEEFEHEAVQFDRHTYVYNTTYGVRSPKTITLS